MPKEDLIELEGLVTELLPDTRFRIQLDNGHAIIAYTAGRMRKNRIKTLAGDRVTLQIFTANDSVRSAATGATNIQRMQTVVSARLGEWVEIGGIGQQGTWEDSQVLGRSTNARSSQRGVMLKVDEVR